MGRDLGWMCVASQGAEHPCVAGRISENGRGTIKKVLGASASVIEGTPSEKGKVLRVVLTRSRWKFQRISWKNGDENAH